MDEDGISLSSLPSSVASSGRLATMVAVECELPFNGTLSPPSCYDLESLVDYPICLPELSLEAGVDQIYCDGSGVVDASVAVDFFISVDRTLHDSKSIDHHHGEVTDIASNNCLETDKDFSARCLKTACKRKLPDDYDEKFSNSAITDDLLAHLSNELRTPPPSSSSHIAASSCKRKRCDDDDDLTLDDGNVVGEESQSMIVIDSKDDASVTCNGLCSHPQAPALLKNDRCYSLSTPCQSVLVSNNKTWNSTAECNVTLDGSIGLDMTAQHCDSSDSVVDVVGYDVADDESCGAIEYLSCPLNTEFNITDENCASTDSEIHNINSNERVVLGKVCASSYASSRSHRISPFLNTPKQRKEEKRKVLKMCIQKMRSVDDPEHFLRRSVLINNTMKRLQRELREEKIRQNSRWNSSSRNLQESSVKYDVFNTDCYPMHGDMLNSPSAIVYGSRFGPVLPLSSVLSPSPTTSHYSSTTPSKVDKFEKESPVLNASLFSESEYVDIETFSTSCASTALCTEDDVSLFLSKPYLETRSGLTSLKSMLPSKPSVIEEDKIMSDNMESAVTSSILSTDLAFPRLSLNNMSDALSDRCELTPIQSSYNDNNYLDFTLLGSSIVQDSPKCRDYQFVSNYSAAKLSLSDTHAPTDTNYTRPLDAYYTCTTTDSSSLSFDSANILLELGPSSSTMYSPRASPICHGDIEPDILNSSVFNSPGSCSSQSQKEKQMFTDIDVAFNSLIHAMGRS